MPRLVAPNNPEHVSERLETANPTALFNSDKVISSREAVDSDGNNSLTDHIRTLYSGDGHTETFAWRLIAGPHTLGSGPGQTAAFTLNLTDDESTALRGLVVGTLVANRFRVRVEHGQGTRQWSVGDLLGPASALELTGSNRFESWGVVAATGGPWMIELTIPATGQATVTFYPIGLVGGQGTFETTNRVYLDYRRNA